MKAAVIKEKEEKKLSKTQLFFLALGGMAVGMVILRALTSASAREGIRRREKLRYYKPSYRQTFWGTYEDWTERDVPLTDEELKKAVKGNKLI